MNANLLSNKEIENYSSNDSFDFKAKADAIKLFLEHNSMSFEKNKMLVLYGDWGSGKTSLMKHIETEIDKGIYYPIFFHAWEHEKDENLPLSLCDALIGSIDTGSDAVKKFIRGAFITLRSFSSGITLKSSGLLSGLGLDFELSGEKFNEALDKALKDSSPKSFYKSNNEFKASFLEVEQLVLKKAGAQKILVFIDDLDRCEPENVLNLITALKLFFTYGEKTVFLCGIDKDAVTKAVKTRYKDVIKSEEYMEKVFDIAFNMPRIFTLSKILQKHFFNLKVKSERYTIASSPLIEEFFSIIEFSNPRHLKKVINKYLIIKSFKESTSLPLEYKNLIPNIITSDREGSVFETILCLFVIILHEFHEKDFFELANYEQKFLKYIEAHVKSNSSSNRENSRNNLDVWMYIDNIQNKNFSNIMDSSRRNTTEYGYTKFILLFSNPSPIALYTMADNTLNKYNECFVDNSISTNLCKFLIKYKDEVIGECYNSPYEIVNLFNMVKYLL